MVVVFSDFSAILVELGSCKMLRQNYCPTILANATANTEKRQILFEGKYVTSLVGHPRIQVSYFISREIQCTSTRSGRCCPRKGIPLLAKRTHFRNTYRTANAFE